MMNIVKLKKALVAVSLVVVLGGCSSSQAISNEEIVKEVIDTQVIKDTSSDSNDLVTGNNTVENVTEYDSLLLDTSDMFSERDLEQKADLSEAKYIDLEDNVTVTIDEEGVYVIKGQANNTMILVDVDKEEKVQLVLDQVTISNESMPSIYVKSADKVFITTTSSNNVLSVTKSFEVYGDVNLDAVIYSKSDLVINGIGNLVINSSQGNGITSKDDLKITGGTIDITSKKDSLEANDSICIYDGNITIVTEKDGLHSENDDDLTLGYIYIQNGNLIITSDDDAIHGTSIVQIDGGTITVISCVEGIEGTYILINDGTIDIYATDDGINATSLSNLDVIIEVNGGDITVDMGSGDTDGFDANGDIIINGGNIDVTGGSTFDADKNAILNGGNVIVNGVAVSELPESQMGGGPKKR